MNMLNIGRMGLAAVFGFAAFAVRAAATMTEVWCSPTGLTTAAYTEEDPGALDGPQLKKLVVTGSAESLSVIHIAPGTYEIAGSQNAGLFDFGWGYNVDIVGDIDDPGKVVLKGAGTTPQEDETVVTNSYVFYIGRLNDDIARIRGITFTNFVCKTAIVDVGAGYGNYSTNLVVENCVFEGNFGPGWAVRGGTVKNCTFRGNTNAASASLVASSNVSGCLFEDNVGVKGVATMDSHCSNTVFRANTATGEGGVLLINQAQTYAVDDCLFESNKALRGGVAVNTYNNRIVNFRNCRFIGNSATDSHGVMKVEGGFSFYDCSFVGNFAATNSGIGRANVFANCVFTNNYAGVDYGVIPNLGAPVVSNCVFYGNGAGRNYGVGYLLNGVISNAVFVNNFALTNSTVYCAFRYAKIYNSVFMGNVSTNTLAFAHLFNSLVVSNRCEDGSYLLDGMPNNCTIVHNKGIPHGNLGGSVDNSILVGNEPCDIFGGAYHRYFNNVIYGTVSNNVYSPLTNCEQVDGAEAVGFWWKDDGKQPFWGIGKNSIARDAGDSEKVPAGLEFDLAGRGRINGDAVDIGCYEWWKPESQGFMMIIR